jgi:hypothetical protein
VVILKLVGELVAVDRERCSLPITAVSSRVVLDLMCLHPPRKACLVVAGA